jgi:2-oxoisovalerate dehydrogenase E1 component
MSEKKKNNSKKVQIEENIDNLNVGEIISESKCGGHCNSSDGPGCSVESAANSSGIAPHIELNLDKEKLLRALRFMRLARYSDEKHLMLVKQGKSFFHIGGSGHEAVQAAVAMSLTPKHDWGWTYYRDSAFMYAMGLTSKEYFLSAFGKPEDPASGGKQMPGHYGHPALNLPTQSSPTGTQFLNAVGTALGAKKLHSDDITYVASGEGTTSQGEFYEAVNWASREKLNVIFCIQDNGYAISVPREKQSSGGGVSHTFCCYANLTMKTFDGTDFFESYRAAKKSVEKMRSNPGPVLLHAMTERLLPHSSSDDHKKYRPEEEILKGKSDRDCIKKLESYLLEHHIASADELNELAMSVKKEIDEAADWAVDRPEPKAEDALTNLWADKSTRELPYATHEPTEGAKIVLVDAVNHAIKEEMRKNPKILVFGEDVADPKGGVFTATRGVSTEFGEDRAFNSPLAEASIIGVAIGLAVRGFKPLVEIQFGDYIWPAFMQIKNELATLRYRSNGGFSSPVVVRVAVGGYIHGGLCHSQNIEAFFAHIPGLMVAYPSTAADAKGLLKAACRMQDPVIFCEHKGMYRLPYASGPEPGEDYLIPFGKARTVKTGADLTIVTYGMCVKDSLNAIRKIEKESDKTVELIDLRTIAPWDKEAVLDSIKKTGKALVVHEDTMTGGFGAEIVATIASEAFNYLDAPVERLTALDSHIPYAQVYENEVLPNEDKIFSKIKNLLKY